MCFGEACSDRREGYPHHELNCSVADKRSDMAVTELGARRLRLCSLGVMGKGCCATKRPSSSTVPNPRNAHTRNPSHSSRTDMTGRHFDNYWKVSRTSGRETQYARDILNNRSRLKSRWIRSSRSEVDVY